MTNNPCSPEDSDAAGHAAFNDLTRRSFLRTTGLVAGGLFALRLSPDALANTNGLSSASSTTDPLGQLYRKLFPADKHLDPIWVKSLTERGVPVRYLKSRNELQYIGMPVGGLMCGTVYLGGDGRLWVWEILNRQHIGVEPNTAINPYNNQPTDPGSGSTYVKPLNQQSSFAQGFALRLQRPGQTPEIRSLDTQGFTEIGFEGSYPLAQVSYSDKDIPVSVTLTSYAPFIPLNEEDSSLPVTILEYEIQNNSNATAKGDIFGWSDNPVGTDSIPSGMTAPTDTRFFRKSTFGGLQYRALPAVDVQRNPTREDIVFADFEQPTYGAWKTEGTAFGTGPARAGVTMPGQQPISGYQGSGFVNSFTQQGDLSTGKLISPDFIIERDYIHFLIGGGNWRGQTCMNLIINGKIIFSKTGIDQEQLLPAAFDVRQFAGKTAHIEVVDAATGPWGHINLDEIVFSDVPPATGNTWDIAPDNGSFVQGLLKAPGVTIFTHQGIAVPPYPESADLPGVGGSFTLTPGQKQRFVFFYAWYFPNLSVDGGLVGRHYQTRFQDAQEVATEVASRYDELAIATKEWVDNWNNSSLPHWFLDRSLIALDTLATESSYRFANGRVWSWEGVGAGPGTCIHVWHYAQSNAHLFPAFSRNLREVTDFSISQDKATGGIAMRAEDDRTVPTDGQAGVILEAWREHRNSADDEFLRRNWPGIREAISYLIEHDTDNDGFIDGPQPVTEDAAWYGKMPFIATLYQAALRASEEMAREVGDPAFASQCHDLYKKSRAAMSGLFNGEFFVQELDPAFQDIVATGPGSFIDQLLGQWWAFQTGLGQITDPSQVKKAMQSLWHYNYTTDVGPFRRQFTSGRTYALDKEAALVMCTWPNGGYRPAWATQWSSEYFNENWTGQEHAAAATMVYAGLLEEGLAVMRSVHDRYHPVKRNPFSEIEYSDHYSRAMSSYSVYLAITGFSYHGPKGEIAFAPKLGADNFQCAFTAAEGWGSFKQQTNGNVREITLTLRYGTLRLNRFSLQNPPSSTARVTLLRSQVNGKVAPATQMPAESGSQVNLQFSPTLVLQKGESLSLYLTT